MSAPITPTLRVAIGITGLSCSLILAASAFGALPDLRQQQILHRKELAESIAIYFSTTASRLDCRSAELALTRIAERQPAIQSISVVHDGEEMIHAGAPIDAERLTSEYSDSHRGDQIVVPILESGTETFGNLRVYYTPLDAGFASILRRPEYSLSLLFGTVGLGVIYVYLRSVLRQLNPRKAVPPRVREALDTLSEGLLLLDQHERIVLANESFEKSTGLTADELVGKRASAIPFVPSDGNDSAHPWQTTLQDGSAVAGKIVDLHRGHQKATYSVSSTAILDDKGNRQGAITSFDDVTEIHQQRVQLSEMVATLKESETEIKERNKELQYLATRDPLTGCLNRRSFFKDFETLWDSAITEQNSLTAFMVDIDHFKSVNDTYGHSVGDEVLKSVGRSLRDTVRSQDIVSRYGGEEFSVLLPLTHIDDAVKVAERVRLAVAALTFSTPELTITASLGVSSTGERPESPQELLEQADQCLYVAKRNGRNQVVRFDQVPEDVAAEEGTPDDRREADFESVASSAIPFHAVSALMSALAFRDQKSANHCRRVADLCVAVAESTLSMRDCYILEIAALLHEVGKIGLPDTILFKRDDLNDAETGVVKTYESIGIQILDRSFDNERLSQIVREFRTPYAAHDTRISEPARVLAIADAFDSLTLGRPGHPGLTAAAAFEELRNEGGRQFDPTLVETFIDRVGPRQEQLQAKAARHAEQCLALNIGTNVEQLGASIDQQDREGITAVASRLQQIAGKYDATDVSEKSGTVSKLSATDCDESHVLSAATELVNLCRTTQSRLLNTPISR